MAQPKIKKATGMPQPSFTQGELSPSLYGRIDFDGYYRGLRTCRNMIVSKYGGVDNRPGTEFIDEINDSTNKARLIPFQFNTEQQYVLELGDYTMRVIADGALIRNDSHSILIVSTPWAVADLPLLKFTQSADVLTVTHPDYPTYQIERVSATSFQVIAFANVNGPFRDINIDKTILVGASATTGTVTITSSKSLFTADLVGLEMYLQSPIDDSTPAWEVGKSVTTGDIIIYGVNYYQALSTGTTGTVAPTHTEGTQKDGMAGILWQYLNSGFGIVKFTAYTDTEHMTATVMLTLPELLVTTTPGGASLAIANVLLNFPGAATVGTTIPHGLIVGQKVLIEGSYNGIADGEWIILSTPAPDSFDISLYWPTGGLQPGGGTVSPILGTYLWALPAWGSDQGYPGTTAYFQNRQLFGMTKGQPVVIWFSRSDGFTDFGYGNPILDDDAIIYKLLASSNGQVNSIKHFLALQYLLILTSGGVWMVQGGSNGKEVLVPGTLDLKWQGEHGVSDVSPLKINNFGLFVTKLGNEVRSLGYSFSENAFVGEDITTMSHHLLQFNTINSWAYQRSPYSCVWSVRDDGILLGCTFFPEQQVNGWHWHDTQGLFEDVCCITENNENAVYFIVNRTLNGQTVRCIERMKPRHFADQADGFFVDCGLTYDGRTDSQPVQAQVFSGLDHLEGETVAIIADGFVCPQQKVVNGEVTIDNPATVVHIGLPYISDFETLDISSMKSNIRDKQKIINALSLIVNKSVGFKVGPDADHLKEYKSRDTEHYNTPDALISDLIDISIPATYNKNGRIFVRQDKPLPLSILCVIPQVQGGGF